MSKQEKTDHIVSYNPPISPYRPIPYPKPLIPSLPSYLSYISFLASIPSFPSFPKLSQPSLLAPFPACSLAACLSDPYLNHFPQIHLLCPQLHRKQKKIFFLKIFLFGILFRLNSLHSLQEQKTNTKNPQDLTTPKSPKQNNNKY